MVCSRFRVQHDSDPGGKAYVQLGAAVSVLICMVLGQKVKLYWCAMFDVVRL